MSIASQDCKALLQGRRAWDCSRLSNAPQPWLSEPIGGLRVGPFCVVAVRNGSALDCEAAEQNLEAAGERPSDFSLGELSDVPET